ncbi:MAG: response regulator [Proteobacteria bacterium]|nr:response regulator [Pseudomonadota bacterium]
MASLNDIHLLIVDDNAQMRKLVRALARAGGIVHLSEAETAAQAIEILRAAPVDLVMVDWKMRPVDGLSFTRMIRWNGNSPNPFVPILMLTAHTEASRVAAARDAGVTGFLKKPISTRLFFDRVGSALTDSRQFIRAEDFFGPDRRRAQASWYVGPFRRAEDKGRADTFDLDDDLRQIA